MNKIHSGSKSHSFSNTIHSDKTRNFSRELVKYKEQTNEIDTPIPKEEPKDWNSNIANQRSDLFLSVHRLFLRSATRSFVKA